MAPFAPTLQDMESVLGILRMFHLPNELALCILDQARYWMEVELSSKEHIILADEAWSLGFSAVYPYLYVPAHPWPHERHLKIREVTFTVVSHDQGWTTEDTQGTYQTSSWFEVSIIRPKTGLSARRHRLQPGLRRLRDMNTRGETVDGVCTASDIIHSNGMVDLVRRPSSVMESHRTHCTEMMSVKPEGREEGEYAWYLQGNEVAREKSVFEGEMIKRYNVTWSGKDHPVQVMNMGSGSGEGFIDSLGREDWICIWARAKVRSKIVSLTNMPTISHARLKERAEARMGKPRPWRTDGPPLHDLTHLQHHPSSNACSP